MTDAKPEQPTADQGAMHLQPLLGGQGIADLVKRQTGARGQETPDPGAMTVQLAARRIALPLGQNCPGRPFQLDHVVDELRRHPEVARRFTMAVALFHNRNNPRPQLNRMWLPYGRPPYLPWLQGITNDRPNKS